jgi:hypothetical protein
MVQEYPLAHWDTSVGRSMYYEMIWHLIDLCCEVDREISRLNDFWFSHVEELYPFIPLLPLKFPARLFSLPMTAVLGIMKVVECVFDGIFALYEDSTIDEQILEDTWQLRDLLVRDRQIIEESIANLNERLSLPTDLLAHMGDYVPLAEEEELFFSELEHYFLCLLLEEKIPDPIAAGILVEWGSFRSLAPLERFLQNFSHFPYLSEIHPCGQSIGEVLEDTFSRIEHRYRIPTPEGYELLLTCVF